MPLVTLVAPCFNEEAVLRDFYAELNRVAALLPAHDFEFLFVDDGSVDASAHILKEICGADGRVRVIRFSRNFGKEAAIIAGLRNARGEYVGVIDADLQHPPELVVDMLRAVQSEGFDCAIAMRQTRKDDSLIRSWFSSTYFRVFNALSETKITSGERDFRLMTRQVVDVVVSLCEYNRFSKGLFGWVGFDSKRIPYESVERTAGQTKWSPVDLARYSLDGIVNFSTMPLRLASTCGFVFCLASVVYGGYIVVDTLFRGNPTPGWPTIATLILFTGGVQLFCVGILGEYLARTYMETKGRPHYVIREFLG
jgi:glucosyltransferase